MKPDTRVVIVVMACAGIVLLWSAATVHASSFGEVPIPQSCSKPPVTVTKGGVISAEAIECAPLLAYDALQYQTKTIDTFDLLQSGIGLFAACGISYVLDTEKGASRVTLPHDLRLLLSLVSLCLFAIMLYLMLCYLSQFVGIIWPLSESDVFKWSGVDSGRVLIPMVTVLMLWSCSKLDGRSIRSVFRSTTLMLVVTLTLCTGWILLFDTSEAWLPLASVFALHVDNVNVVSNVSVFFASIGTLLAV